MLLHSDPGTRVDSDERGLRVRPTTMTSRLQKLRLWGNPEQIVQKNGDIPAHKMFDHRISLWSSTYLVCSELQSFEMPEAYCATRVVSVLPKDIYMPQYHLIGKIP